MPNSDHSSEPVVEMLENVLSASSYPEEEFAIRINLAMVRGILDKADPDQMASICINTALELFDHYGAGEDHSDFIEFVKSAEFGMAEIEEWIDRYEDGVN